MHAFLVLAHADPAMTERLTQCLARAGEVYVHVDARTDIDAFRGVSRHAVLVPARVPVHWGGWNISVATALLACRALENPATSRLTLVSGAHYPLLSPDHLADMGDGEHIRLIAAPDASAGKPACRFERRYVSRFAPASRASVLANGVARRLPRLNVDSALAGRRLYAGSTWWSLTRDTYEAAVAELDADRVYLNYLRSITAPDETGFHTAVGAVLERRHGVPAPEVAHRETTFVSWAGGRHPEPLTAALIRRARSEDWWFARKFTSDRPDLLDAAEAGW